MQLKKRGRKKIQNSFETEEEKMKLKIKKNLKN